MTGHDSRIALLLSGNCERFPTAGVASGTAFVSGRGASWIGARAGCAQTAPEKSHAPAGGCPLAWPARV